MLYLFLFYYVQLHILLLNVTLEWSILMWEKLFTIFLNSISYWSLGIADITLWHLILSTVLLYYWRIVKYECKLFLSYALDCMRQISSWSVSSSSVSSPDDHSGYTTFGSYVILALLKCGNINLKFTAYIVYFIFWGKNWNIHLIYLVIYFCLAARVCFLLLSVVKSGE